LYFEQLGSEKEEKPLPEIAPETIEHEVYQCSDCLTIYDPQYGEPSQEIAPETPFEDLPDAFVCSLCEAPKTDFQKKIVTKV